MSLNNETMTPPPPIKPELFRELHQALAYYERLQLEKKHIAELSRGMPWEFVSESLSVLPRESD